VLSIPTSDIKARLEEKVTQRRESSAWGYEEKPSIFCFLVIKGLFFLRKRSNVFWTIACRYYIRERPVIHFHIPIIANLKERA
jgi:hypothetical protein